MVVRIPDEVRPVLALIGRVAHETGMTAYVVGGFVRDLLLGSLALDWDIVVEGNAPQLAKGLADRWKASLTVHHRFLTATLQWKPPTPAPAKVRRIDFVTARRERYPHPAALPEVEPATIEEDLWRRDFSINAIAICLAPHRFGELVDPTNGCTDLQHGIIRALHSKSFVDDPTRIFRAVRYEQRFGFRMERKTLRWLCQARDESWLTHLSHDRIKHELWRTLQERAPRKPLQRLHQLRILPIVAPELRITRRRLGWLERLTEWLEWFGKRFPEEAVEREWALLLPLLPTAEAMASFCERYQLGERRKEEGIAFLRALKRKPPRKPSHWVWWLNALAIEAALALASRVTLPSMETPWLCYFTRWRFVRPDISGNVLKAYGVEGPAIAFGLRVALAAKLDEGAGAEEQLHRALNAVRRRAKTADAL